jgi:hypothetical protein
MDDLRAFFQAVGAAANSGATAAELYAFQAPRIAAALDPDGAICVAALLSSSGRTAHCPP